MMGKVKRTYYLTPGNEEFLRREAFETRLPASTIINRALEQYQREGATQMATMAERCLEALQAYTGDDEWNGVFYRADGFDPDATDQADPGNSTVAVFEDGSRLRWVEQDQEWVAEGPSQYRITYVEPGIEPVPGQAVEPRYADTLEEARELVADLMEQPLRPELEGGAGEQVGKEWVPVEAWCETTDEMSPWYCIERRIS